MTRLIRSWFTACLMTSAVLCSRETAAAQIGDGINPPPVPAGLQPPAGNMPFLKGHAAGTQNYICTLTDTGYAWKPIGPQATLFITFRWITGDISQQIITHFLSPNPVEGGTARATWQSSLDTSAVWAVAQASSSDTKYVAPGAIPWLLLQVAGTMRGPAGGELLTATTYIQRLNTTGGPAPALPCDSENNLAVTKFVPYTADYFFYRPIRRP